MQSNGLFVSKQIQQLKSVVWLISNLSHTLDAQGHLLGNLLK